MLMMLIATVFLASAEGGLHDVQSLHFTTIPRDATFLNTRTTKIECQAGGLPKPSVSWETISGRPVRNISDIRRVNYDGSLEFLAFHANQFNAAVHRTQYRCVAKSALGKLRSATIRVRAIIGKLYSPKVFHQKSFHGGSAVFQCSLDADTLQHASLVSWTLVWPKTNRKIEVANGNTKERFHVFKGLRHLVISNVTKDDDFLKVSCKVKDNLSNVILRSSEAYLFVNVAPPSKFRFSLPPISQVWKKGSTVFLPCIANTKPTDVRYSWLKDGGRLHTSGRILRQFDGILMLKNVEEHDKGEYKCIATTTNETISAAMTLGITDSVKFVKRIHDKFIPIGQSVLFSCKATGLPVPSITWLKDGAPISTSSRITLLPSNILSSDLQLSLASNRDEGIYQCVAMNSIEEIVTGARLVIGARKPSITIGLEESRILEQDRSVSFTCVASGQPLPKLTWWSDGVEINNRESRFTTTTKNKAPGVQSVLTIQGLRMSDSATYACKAGNKAGFAVSQSNVVVSGSPMIISFPEQIYAIINQPVYLHCIAKGHPLATHKWTKDGLQNLNSADQHRIFENGTLLINSVQLKSKGEYRCKASNDFGEDVKTLVLYVEVPPTIAPFQWTPIEAGHRTSKTCQVPTGDLPIRITWYWNGKIINNNDGVSIDNRTFLSHLLFSEVKVEHRGRYTCKAENKAGSTSYSEELVVQESPRLTEAPTDASVLKPNTLHLKCKASGYPTPQIVWYKIPEFGDRRELLRLTNRIEQHPNGSLFISSTSERDNGKYTCSAENGVSKNAEKTVVIDIKVPAKVKKGRTRIVRRRKGSSANVNCKASGTPPVDLLWYKSSKKITISQKYDTATMFTKIGNQAHLNSTLQIRHLARSDNGTYICQVTNSFGGDTEQFHLIVLERPDPPKQPSVSKKSSRWIEIEWKPSFGGHSPITSYTVEYKRHSELWRKKVSLRVLGNTTKAVIDGLSPGVHYNFRIIASNRIGWSEPSDHNVFRTNEEAPSAPPENVVVTAIAKDKLKVEWRAPVSTKRNGLIAGYYISYTDATSKKQKKVLGPLNFEVFLENLTPYTTYHVEVSAFTRAGMGPWSPTVRKRTLPGAPSAAPLNIKASPITSQIIRVSWTLPPHKHHHGLIKGYKVKYSEKFSKTKKEKVVRNVHYAELTNLKKYTEYRIAILAFTDGGDGKLSDNIIARTLEDVPGPPEQLRAAAASPDQILVTWKRPSKPNGIITGYILHYRKSMDLSTSQHEFPLSSNKSSHMLRGLEVGKEYEVWMVAQTKIGKGMRTGLVRTRTMTKIPARILTLTQIVKVAVNSDVGLPCVAVGHPKPIISWYFKNSRIIKRRRRSVPYYNEGKLVLSNVGHNDAGAYNCSAVNQYGSDWNLITLVVQGVPLPPRAIHAEQINNSSVNISWTPGFSSHSKIIRHQIRYRYGNTSGWNHATAVSEWKLFDLNYGAKAQFSVASENSVGVGKYSKILEVTSSSKGLVTRIISHDDKAILRSAFVKEEKENVLAPIIAGCIVAVVIVTIIMLLASWDRVERRMRTPKCHRLFVCECEDSFTKGRFRGPYDGPYSEPHVPWPWNSTGNSLPTSSDDPPNSEPTGDEERFPEHLFAQLLNFDETEEHDEKSSEPRVISSPDKDDCNIGFGTSSTNTYKTSECSQFSKGVPASDASNSLLSSRTMPSSVASENGVTDQAVKLKTRSVEDSLETKQVTKKSYRNEQIQHYFKSLDSGLQCKPNIKVYVNQGTSQKGKSSQVSKEPSAPKGIKSLTLLVRDSKVKRSRSVRSYDSVSSTCSSTRGELVRAYEFGRKYKLQEYFVPHVGDSTTEDSCSEISELCEFTSLPRNTNDCLLRMPLPIRPTVNNPTFRGLQVKNIHDPYGGESLV